MAAGRGAEKADALRIDAELAGLAAHELHAGEHVLHGLREGLALGRQPIADGEHRIAACRQIRPPKLERGAHALDPAAAVHGHQRRRCFCALRQIEVALQLDAVVVGIGDAKMGCDVIRGHCWASPVVRAYRVRSGVRCQSAAHAGRARHGCRSAAACAMAKYISRARTIPREGKSRALGGGMSVASSREAQSLVVNGTRIDVIEKGSGPPLFFLHAENGIEPAAAAIDELAKHARVIAPTHPGYGRSELPKGMRSVDDLSYFYLDLLDQLDLHGVAVVGVSL